MPWEQKPIPAPLIDGLEELAVAISSVTQPVVVLLDIASKSLEVAQLFFSTTGNPTTALALALIDELEALNNDIFGTGVFQLITQPFEIAEKLNIPGVGSPSVFDSEAKLIEVSGGTLAPNDFGVPQLTPSKNIDKILQSFDDAGDVNRPIFSDNSEVCAFGFLLSAPDIDGFNNVLESLSGVWDFGEFARLLEKLKNAVNDDNGGDIPIPSRKPDWDSVRFNSVKFLADTQNELNKQLAFMRGLIGSTDDMIGDFLELVERKIDNLTRVIDEFNDLIDTIKNALNASGVYLLDVPPAIGGVNYLKEQIEDSQFQSSRDLISASVVYVGGGASLAAVNSIRLILT